jgi:hypothetical protein
MLFPILGMAGYQGQYTGSPEIITILEKNANLSLPAAPLCQHRNEYDEKDHIYEHFLFYFFVEVKQEQGRDRR